MARNTGAWLLLVALISTPIEARYSVSVSEFDKTPLISSILGTTSFAQVFNPAFVQASPRLPKSGILIRSQNCSASPGGQCVKCSGSGQNASLVSFSERLQNGSFSYVGASDVVFGPRAGDYAESYGTEDPRLVFDPHTSLYYMFYTAYGTLSPTTKDTSVMLSVASTLDPTTGDGWTRHGPLFGGLQNTKSGAMLVPTSTSSNYLLFWGDSQIRVTNSSSPTSWVDEGVVLLSPRPDNFDSGLVESGPPPLLLSTGDYLFFYNSASAKDNSYHPGWVILSQADPTIVVQRCDTPLLSPTYAWETGTAPFSCNVPNVVFLQGAEALGNDTFRIYFGGADAVVGTAVVTVSAN